MQRSSAANADGNLRANSLMPNILKDNAWVATRNEGLVFHKSVSPSNVVINGF